VARALRFSTEERDTLLRLHDQPPALPAEEECARRRWLALLGKAEWADHCAWLAEARGAGSQAALRDWVAATPVPEFPLLGRDAMALGVTPGPRIGALLAAARQWWLAGGCIADRAACLERLRELAVAAGV
jgi:poly(A) polymerase/tRNA nucleotidyltransferase (CCA-adding enzyme)